VHASRHPDNAGRRGSARAVLPLSVDDRQTVPDQRLAERRQLATAVRLQSRTAQDRHCNASTYGDSDVISMPSGFRHHLVGKTLINVFHCNIAETRLVGKLVIIETFHKPTDRMPFK